MTGSNKRGLKNIAHLADRLDVIAGNIASQDSIDLINRARPEIIFHLAAEAYVPKSFTQPLDVYAVNLNGTLNVLEAGRKIKSLKRIVVTSSSEVYGSYAGSISEENLLNPTSPYGASKVAADRAAYSWYFTYNLPVAIIRPFNTYGPRHTYDVIPKFINLALSGKPLTVHGTGKQSRDFTYVSDTINGFLLMGIHPKAVGEVVNFGAGTATSIDKIAKTIVKLTGSTAGIIYDGARLAEVTRLTCNWGKAKKLFGWAPLVDLEEGIMKNIKWQRDNR
jgi:nucleoside-diphosphate-sugar epimerase